MRRDLRPTFPQSSSHSPPTTHPPLPTQQNFKEDPLRRDMRPTFPQLLELSRLAANYDLQRLPSIGRNTQVTHLPTHSPTHPPHPPIDQSLSYLLLPLIYQTNPPTNPPTHQPIQQVYLGTERSAPGAKKRNSGQGTPPTHPPTHPPTPPTPPTPPIQNAHSKSSKPPPSDPPTHPP